MRNKGIKCTKRFYCLVRVAIVLFISALLLGCFARMTIKETPHYKVYEDVILTALANFGIWAKTEIHIPEDAIVAVMVKGELWDIWLPNKLRWQPYQCLRFKVGKSGIETPIRRGIDRERPSNLTVVPSGKGGPLYFGMSTWWGGKLFPEYMKGEMVVRVIVWEKSRQGQIEGDLLELIKTHPDDQQFRDLFVGMSPCLFEMDKSEEEPVPLGEEITNVDQPAKTKRTVISVSNLADLRGEWIGKRTPTPGQSFDANLEIYGTRLPIHGHLIFHGTPKGTNRFDFKGEINNRGNLFIKGPDVELSLYQDDGRMKLKGTFRRLQGGCGTISFEKR